METQNTTRLTDAEKDRRYGPVFDLMVKAREAHSALTKANKTGAAVEQVTSLKDLAKAADEAVKETQSGYGLDDIKLLLGYATRAIIFDALTPDGKGGFRWDSQKSRWLAKTLMSVLDDRSLPREDKDHANSRESLAEQRQRSVEAFIDLFEKIGRTPKFGMNDRAVRYGLSELNKKIGALSKSTQRSEQTQARELNALYAKVKNSVPPSWLQNKEHQHGARTSTTIGAAVGSEGVDALQAAVGGEGAGDVVHDEESGRGGRQSGRRNRRSR